MRVLEKTRMLTVAQVFRILRASDERVIEPHVIRLLRQLRYMQKLRFKTEDLVTLPSIIQQDRDPSILAVTDIMLDISKGTPLDIGCESPPFALRFLTDDGDRVGNYGIIIVKPGSETMINFQVEEVSNRTIIYLVDNIEQRAQIKTKQPHYFAVNDGDKYRYYAG